MIREDKARQFLNQVGWGEARMEPLAGDASFRAYARVFLGEQSAMLMDAPPPQEDIRPFAALDLYLRDQGLQAPTIYGHDSEAGFLLLEDFGDTRFSTALEMNPGDEDRLYEAATDVLIHLAHIQPPLKVDGLHEPYYLRTYGPDILQKEADFLFEWAWPVLMGAADQQLHKDYLALWAPHFQFLEQRLALDPCLVLRDYHVDNLMVLHDHHGLEGVGLLDFQDALLGDKAYDLVSLLQDARRDVPEPLEARLLDHFIRKSGIEDIEDFRTAYAILGAHRSLRIVGIFIRLWKRDGKPRYLEHLPRLWRYISRNLEHPALADLKQWYDIHIPQNVREKTAEDLL
ncbi:MAG: phosphotransferase [Sphingomonadales bacterium]|jgi:hypothetical protein